MTNTPSTQPPFSLLGATVNGATMQYQMLAVNFIAKRDKGNLTTTGRTYTALNTPEQLGSEPGGLPGGSTVMRGFLRAARLRPGGEEREAGFAMFIALLLILVVAGMATLVAGLVLSESKPTHDCSARPSPQ